MIREILASAALVWYVAVVAVCTVGYVQLFRYYSKPPPPARCLTELSPKDLPHVTIIRPVKGLEPSLYQCLAATFLQTYPRRKLTLYFCVESRKDPAVPVIERLLKEFSDFDAKLLVEEEDPELNNGNIVLGPNPKIRNMSRAYREAKGDLIWIIDCNVWVGKGVAGRMVDTLSGFRGKKNKFVHQLPLVVDTAAQTPEQIGLLSDEGGSTANSVVTTNAGSTGIQDAAGSKTGLGAILSRGGGRLEEMFMSSAHAKFYTAINTVLIAPCIVGKSTMFRKSHLDYLTSKRSTNPKRSPGIDFFSDNICEDHLIGDLLWKNKVPQEEAGQNWGKHAMVFGDLAVQPMAGMSVREYIARRVRWLRVRKFTVTLATLVEHGTESIACSLYGAYAITTLPWFSEKVGIPPTWLSFTLFFFYSMTMWCLIDWTQYIRLHSAASIEVDNKTPDFALLTSGARLQTGTITPRSFSEWVLAWCGREILAFPIWFWAVFGGVSVTWRGKRFWVGLDMKVHEIEEKSSAHHESDATKRKRRAS